MKSDRIYPYLVAALILLLLVSGILAYVFYSLLLRDTSPSGGAAGSEQATGGTEASPRHGAWSFLSGDQQAPGQDGSLGKWGSRDPSAPFPKGYGPSIAGWTPEAAEGFVPSFPSMPLMFDEDCQEYGGPYDLTAAGAGLNMFLHPGSVCLDVHRPEVYVEQDQKRRYTPAGQPVSDACALERTVQMCFSLGDINPSAQGRNWHPIYQPNAARDLGPTNLLEEWHLPFASEEDFSESSQHGRQAPAAVDDATLAEEERSFSRRQYFLSNNPRDWFGDLPAGSYSTLRDIRPGVDVSCFADQNRLEYLFVFWPGVDPQDVEFTYDTAASVHYATSGNLAIEYECATLLQHRPIAYKWRNDEPYETPATYSLRGKTVRLDIQEPLGAPLPKPNTIGGDDDALKRPMVDYLSYLGGKGDDHGYVVAVDNRGNAYLAGSTTSHEFGTGSGKDDGRGENVDVFVSKIQISDRKVLYTTILGGRHEDRALDMVADAAGNVYICGETLSPDFATVTPPPGGVLGRAWDAFVVKLDPEGQMRDFSFRLGGRGDDRAFGIALDAATNLYVAGTTLSDDFPTTGGSASSGKTGTADAFLVKMPPTGKTLTYALRFGGSGDDQAYALVVDAAGHATIAGETTSRDLPTALAPQPEYGGGARDGYVARFAPDGAVLTMATYLGGANDDRALGVDADAAGDAYVVGETSSENFPVLNAVQPRFAGGKWDAFLCRLGTETRGFRYSTYIGGSGDDRGFAVSVEASGAPHFAGTTSSTNLPLVRPLQKQYGGGSWDALLGGLDETGSQVRYLSTVGGSGKEQICRLAMEAGHILHLAGETSSEDLPVVDALQNEYRGGNADALLGRLLTDYPHTPELRLVPAGGMAQGPYYDFYVSTYEIMNEEFVRFLNDAQSNPDSSRGTNMVFDAFGDVWMSPEMMSERDELFTARDSRIVYNPALPVGARYFVTPRPPREGGTYARHPVAGVSWYGAVKFCNWLTVNTGRGENQRCYREGPHPGDWAPVTAGSEGWARGEFGARQRHAWLRYRGFRLPMDNCAAAIEREGLYFRVTNEEWSDFLNDTQSHPTTLRGTNMVFGSDGSVYCSPETDTDALLFDNTGSRISYDTDKAPGARYAVLKTPPEEAIPYAQQAVSNVSWYGAMKYCNWLTLMDAMPPEQRCYREGSQARDWAPTTASIEGWQRGEITAAERDAWLKLRGYRLPFASGAVNTNTFSLSAPPGVPTNSWPNVYNEVLKASGWGSSTNSGFGFGRDQFDPRDANYLDNGLSARHDTTPAGFFDGSDHEGRFQTRTNDNLYGIYDLSGNISEWTSDPGRVGSAADRSYYGGSWRFPLPHATERAYVHPYFTENFMGFRVVTTMPSDEMHVVRVPFRLCVCGYGVGPGCGRGEGKEGKEGGEKKTGKEGEGKQKQGLGPGEFSEIGTGGGVILKPGTGGGTGPGEGGEGGGGGGGVPEESAGDDGGAQEQVTLSIRDASGTPTTLSVPLADVPKYLARGYSLGAAK